MQINRANHAVDRMSHLTFPCSKYVYKIISQMLHLVTAVLSCLYKGGANNCNLSVSVCSMKVNLATILYYGSAL